MAKDRKKAQDSGPSRNYGSKLKHEFNRVVSHPDYFQGAPFVKDADIPVDDIINLFEKGFSDKAIQGKYPDMDDNDLDACRAYQVRFRPKTLKATHTLDPNNKFFLLDENTSYFLLYDVAKIFGWSTHVGAEGLQGKDDERDIWPRAIKEKYKAILTADTDFIGISSRHRKSLIAKYGDVHKSPNHTPTVIHIENNVSRNETIYLLNRYQDEIRLFVAQNNHTHASLGKNGLTAGTPDNNIKQALKAANNNKPSP